jgi:hypothetical protein
MKVKRALNWEYFELQARVTDKNFRETVYRFPAHKRTR